MLIKIYAQNPSEKELQRVAEALEDGEVIIYPTDSVYAFGCSLRAPKGLDRLRRIRDKETENLSIIFGSIAQLSEYCKIDNQAFKLLRDNLPGPFTFILPASSRLPDKAIEKRKTIGVRIPDNAITLAILERLGCPLITASVRSDESESEYTTDPELIHERYGRDVALVIDGGVGADQPTTVVDLTGDEPLIVRMGLGELKYN